MRDTQYNKVTCPLYLLSARSTIFKDALLKFHESLELNLDSIRADNKKYQYLFISELRVSNELEDIILFTTIEKHLNFKISAKIGIISSETELELVNFEQ